MHYVRWSPFRDVARLQNRMNRLFEDPFQGTGQLDSRELTYNWMPAADIYEADTDLIVTADLPGVDPKLIDVSVENNVLTIRGERLPGHPMESDKFYRIERTYGTFVRSFALSTTVDPDKIRGDYKDGVLRLVLPKADRARPKKIEIAAAA
jgi:HSP20 family protein